MKEHLSGSASPTERTMAWLRAQGYTVEKVEQRITRRVTRDFCGFADIIAFNEAVTVAVQATDGGHLAERVAKIRAEPRADRWLCNPGRLVWAVGWDLRGGTGKRKVYVPNVVVIGDNEGP